jgi:hypothetical protein
VSADISKPGTPVSYDEHIRPLFREHEHESMRFAFDLWSYEDVSANATAIFEKLSTGATDLRKSWLDVVKSDVGTRAGKRQTVILGLLAAAPRPRLGRSQPKPRI